MIKFQGAVRCYHIKNNWPFPPCLWFIHQNRPWSCKRRDVCIFGWNMWWHWPIFREQFNQNYQDTDNLFMQIYVPFCRMKKILQGSFIFQILPAWCIFAHDSWIQFCLYLPQSNLMTKAQRRDSHCITPFSLPVGFIYFITSVNPKCPQR